MNTGLDFQIKKGLRENLVDTDGRTPKIELTENCWYLTLDTAELFVAVRADQSDENSQLVLKKLNDFEVESFDPKVQFVSEFNNLPVGDNTDQETLYVVNDENATYRWDGTRYVCVGRDYNEITLIMGGDADPSDD